MRALLGPWWASWALSLSPERRVGVWGGPLPSEPCPGQTLPSECVTGSPSSLVWGDPHGLRPRAGAFRVSAGPGMQKRTRRPPPVSPCKAPTLTRVRGTSAEAKRPPVTRVASPPSRDQAAAAGHTRAGRHTRDGARGRREGKRGTRILPGDGRPSQRHGRPRHTGPRAPGPAQ